MLAKLRGGSSSKGTSVVWRIVGTALSCRSPSLRRWRQVRCAPVQQRGTGRRAHESLHLVANIQLRCKAAPSEVTGVDKDSLPCTLRVPTPVARLAEGIRVSTNCPRDVPLNCKVGARTTRQAQGLEHEGVPRVHHQRVVDEEHASVRH